MRRFQTAEVHRPEEAYWREKRIVWIFLSQAFKIRPQAAPVEISPLLEFKLQRYEFGGGNRVLPRILTRTHGGQIEVLQEPAWHFAAGRARTDEIDVIEEPAGDWGVAHRKAVTSVRRCNHSWIISAESAEGYIGQGRFKPVFRPM